MATTPTKTSTAPAAQQDAESDASKTEAPVAADGAAQFTVADIVNALQLQSNPESTKLVPTDPEAAAAEAGKPVEVPAAVAKEAEKRNLTPQVTEALAVQANAIAAAEAK